MRNFFRQIFSFYAGLGLVLGLCSAGWTQGPLKVGSFQTGPSQTDNVSSDLPQAVFSSSDSPLVAPGLLNEKELQGTLPPVEEPASDSSLYQNLFQKDLPYVQIMGKIICFSNFPLNQTEHFEEDILRLQEDLIKYLGIPQPKEIVELCLFRDEKTYVAFIKEFFDGAPTDRPALYVKGNGPGVLMIKRDKNLMLNIRHEMTHAFLNSSLKNVPIWLDEGLAKYFELTPGTRGFQNPFLIKIQKSVKNRLNFKKVPSLTRLEKLYGVDQMQSREYLESWAWVHFMMHYSRETHQLLAQYLLTLTQENQAGIDAEEARKIQNGTPLTKILQERFPDYKQMYEEHFLTWREQSGLTIPAQSSKPLIRSTPPDTKKQRKIMIPNF